MSDASIRINEMNQSPISRIYIAASSRGLFWLPIVTLVSLICVPYVSTTWALKLILWISFGLCALSLDFVWGKAGIFSFGQNAIFGIGGYAYAIIALNYYQDSGETISALLGAGVAGAIIAAALGYFLFYSRLNDVYLSIVTLAVTLITYTVLSSTAGPEYQIGQALLGGFNGIPGVPSVAFPDWTGVGDGELDIRELLVFAIVFSALIYFSLDFLTRGNFGLKIDGLRSNEVRMELLGYDVRRLKLLAFSIGGAVAGLGGGLFAAWGTFINPSIFSLAQAATVVVWVMVGGRGTLVGAFVGVFIVQSVSDGADLIVEQQTPLLVGLILIAVVMLVPGGLIPTLAKLLPTGPRRPFVNAKAAHMDRTIAERNGELSVDGIMKHFGGVHVLRGVDSSFGSHPVHAIIGPNGAGKSTFFNILTGRHKPDSGAVTLNRADVSKMPTHMRCRNGLGIKMQVPSVFPELTVQENLQLAALASNTAQDLVEVLRLVGLEARVDELASLLSHGQQQWLEIALVLVQNPSVILLDEPGAGMGDDDKRKTISLIHELSKHHTLVVVEHDMEFIKSLNAPVMMLHQGKVFRSGSFDELMNDNEVIDTYLGRRSHA